MHPEISHDNLGFKPGDGGHVYIVNFDIRLHKNSTTRLSSIGKVQTIHVVHELNGLGVFFGPVSLWRDRREDLAQRLGGIHFSAAGNSNCHSTHLRVGTSSNSGILSLNQKTMLKIRTKVVQQANLEAE